MFFIGEIIMNGKKETKTSSVRHVELFNFITEIEKKFDVDKISLDDGTKLWNPVRTFLYFHVLNKPSRSGSLYYKKLFYMFIESLSPINIPGNNKIWGFSTSRHRRHIENKCYDIFMDPLYDVIGDEFVVFERASTEGYHRKYKGKLYSKNYVSMHISIFTKTFWALTFNKLFQNRKIKIKSKETLDEIIKFYSDSTSTNYDKLRNDVYNLTSLLWYNKKFYVKLLKKKKPKMILMVAGHSAENMALTQACKECNIPSIELQHGMILEYHPGYLRFTKSKNRDYRPDYLLTFGDVFTNTVRKGNLFDKDKVISIGFSFLENKRKSPAIVDKNLHDFVKNHSKTILVTSQWNFADEIKDFVIKLSKKLKKLDKKVGIVFKPHPSDWREYTDLDKYDDIFLANKYDDLYEIFKKTDIHSTLYSTSSLEALSFGKPNIFLEIGNIKEMFDIIDNKASFNAKNPDEYFEKLKHVISNYKKISEEATKVGNSFYKNNSKENLKEFFKEMKVKSNNEK